MTLKEQLYKKVREERERQLALIGRKRADVNSNKRFNKKMNCMTPIKRGEVFWIDELEIKGNNEIGKNRLAVVVSNNDFNYHNGNIQVAYLTSQPKKDSQYHVKLDYLGTPSTILCEQVTTVSVERVGGRNGYIPKYIMDKVSTGISYVMELTNSRTTYEESLMRRNKELEETLLLAYSSIKELEVKRDTEGKSIQSIINEIKSSKISWYFLDTSKNSYKLI